MSEAEPNKPTNRDPNYAAMGGPELIQALDDDATKWATAFCQLNPGIDHGLMVTWFANCIERSHEVRTGRAQPFTDFPASGPATPAEPPATA